MDPYCTTRTIGASNRQRQIGAAALLLVGAVGCAVTTLVGWPLYQTLIVLGAAATVAWLADGTSQRFMGPGLAALAVGSGITAYRALGTEPMAGEHGIVYPALGVALLLASLFNPMAIRGAGTFLLIVGAVALIDTAWAPGWTLVAILAVWGALEFGRISRRPAVDEEPAPAATDGRTRRETRSPVGAGAGR